MDEPQNTPPSSGSGKIFLTSEPSSATQTNDTNSNSVANQSQSYSDSSSTNQMLTRDYSIKETPQAQSQRAVEEKKLIIQMPEQQTPKPYVEKQPFQIKLGNLITPIALIVIIACFFVLFIYPMLTTDNSSIGGDNDSNAPILSTDENNQITIGNGAISTPLPPQSKSCESLEQISKEGIIGVASLGKTLDSKTSTASPLTKYFLIIENGELKETIDTNTLPNENNTIQARITNALKAKGVTALYATNFSPVMTNQILPNKISCKKIPTQKISDLLAK